MWAQEFCSFRMSTEQTAEREEEIKLMNKNSLLAICDWAKEGAQHTKVARLKRGQNDEEENNSIGIM